MLTEQVIEDMFQDDNSKEIEPLPQELSLNYTASSRSTKQPHKEPLPAHKQQNSKDSFNILTLASQQLSKFNQWLVDSDSKLEQNFSTITSLLLELQNNQYQQNVNQEELSIIKNELFKKQNDQLQDHHCKECPHLKEKIGQLETVIAAHKQAIEKYQLEAKDLANKLEMQELREELLNKVEINLLHSEIAQLNNQITILKNEKYSLEKTNLFNKTKNSDLYLKMELQKSKGLSAAKNSTNSSELMNRNQETIVFIDPIESDVEEWIRFFEIQKNKYMSMCKKQQSQRMKALGRAFTKEEKIQLHEEGRIFIIFSSIKDIWKNLIRIKENTRSFLAVESHKNLLKDKLINDVQPSLKQQQKQLSSKLVRVSKLNEYLLCQKQNLHQINQGLQQQMARQNAAQHKTQTELLLSLQQIQSLKTQLLEYQKRNKNQWIYKRT